MGRRLGQHFLKSKDVVRKIIRPGEVSYRDTILEIGPGKGILTEELLKNAGSVFAIEKDTELFESLQKKFKSEIKQGKLVLINDDILSLKIENYKLENYKVIANIPYYITGAILKKFLTGEHQPERMVLLVQREVGERVVARAGKESILSISVKAYGVPKVVARVPARYFSPAPKVDSAILSITDISRHVFVKNKLNEERFWQIVKKAFAHKRKKLAGNLKGVVPNEILARFSQKRAENLQLADWVSLSRG